MKKGFLLLEFTVVLALISFIALLTAQFTLVTDTAFVRAELEKLCACMLYMQAQARITQKAQMLTFDIHNHSYTSATRVYKLSHACFGFCQNAYGPPSCPTQPLHDAVTFKDKKIIFYPDGTISSGAVYLTDKKRSCLYALTCGIAQVSYIRRYRYQTRWLALV